MNALQALCTLSLQYEENSTTRRFLNQIICGVSEEAEISEHDWHELEPKIIQATVTIKDDVLRKHTDPLNFATYINNLAMNQQR